MNRPYLKYYLYKNPNFGKPKPPFVPPTREDYEEYLNQDDGSIVSGSHHIRPYEKFVERYKEEYDKEDPEVLIDSVSMGLDAKDDNNKIISIEQSEDFIKWM